MDARRAPEGIGEGHGANELCNLAVEGRSTGWTASGLPVPEGAEALPVPANDGLRLNEMERLAPPHPPLRLSFWPTTTAHPRKQGSRLDPDERLAATSKVDASRRRRRLRRKERQT